MEGVFKYQLKHADAYNGPDKNKGVNVNSGALFIRFAEGNAKAPDGPWGEWFVVGKTKSAVQAKQILLDCISVTEVKMRLRLSPFEWHDK